MIDLSKLYFGIVEDVNDPLQIGRLKVRIYGIHTENKAKIPTQALPWCDVMMSVDNPFISSLGWSPTGMVNGQEVVLVPYDDFLQEWMIIGTRGGNRQPYNGGKVGFNDPSGTYPKKGVGDVNILAKGTASDFKSENKLKVDVDGSQKG